MNAKRILSSVMALLIALSLLPGSALAAFDFDLSDNSYYNVISKKDWDIAPGITESEIVLNNDAGNYRQVLHFMEADLNNEYVKVINSYTGMVPKYGSYTTGTMSKQAFKAEELGYGNVVGAMNTCLSWYTGYPADRVGEPLGFIMLDGETLFDPGNCGYTYGNVGFPSVLVINKDFDENGNPRPADIPKVEMPQIRSSADLDGWEDQVIPCSSGYILKDGVVNATGDYATGSAPRSVVGIKADGTVVILLNDGRQSPFSAGMNLKELAEVMKAAGCVYAVNCDGGGSSTFLSQRPGEELKVNNSPSDGAERPTTSGILFISTAPADGAFGRAHISADNTYFTPGSKVEFDVIGTDLAGTTVDIPADAVWQLKDASFGTIEDGVFTSNGKEGEVTVQMVYEGKVVGETTITIVTPDIAFRNETIVIGYGDSMPLPVDVTTNEGRNPVTYADGDIVYTLSDENLGTIVGDQFTACDADSGLTSGTITAVICGQTEKAVTATIKFGKASEIAYDFEGDEFLIDEDPEVAPAEGEPYGWFIRDTRANGYFAYRFFAKKAYTPVGLDIPAKVYLTDKMSRNGDQAMGIDIDWTNVTASCHGQMDIFLPESLDLTDATRVGFWFYVPAEIVTDSMQFRIGLKTTSGGYTSVNSNYADMIPSGSGVDNGGWVYLSWEVLDTYAALEYIQINSHYTTSGGQNSWNYYQDATFYIDDITVDYSDATVDRENPYFTSMTIADDYTNGEEVNGQTITSNTVTLMAQAYENTIKTNATGLNRNSIKLYVDGVRSDADVAMANNGTVTVSDLYLNDGVHTLVMEVCDEQGNVGNIVRKLVVNTEKSGVRLEVPVTDELLPTGSIYWVNLVADNLSEVKSVSTTITLDYVNDWELEGMEVAYGFKAKYYIDNHNDAVITFTRTGDEVADTDVLAKLPIRIWMARGWMDDSGIRETYISDDPKKQDKYHILTPHAMWYSDGTRNYKLVVGAEAGVAEYTDGTVETFSAMDTLLQTEMNRYYTTTDRQNKWSFHICTPGIAQSKAATCTEIGYTNRVFCVACACGSVENLGAECDTHKGCGSVLEWGTVLPATGHNWQLNAEGKLACVTGGELFNGVYTDGKTYVDGVVAADGWNAEGTSYYKDGVKVTGAYVIDKVVYVFDANGIYQSDVGFSGFIETAEGDLMYFNSKTDYVTGYHYYQFKQYYFDENGIARDGTYVIGGQNCFFEDGQYVGSEREDVVVAGWGGKNVTFILFADGTFQLDGNGPMFDINYKANVPWDAYQETQIKKVFVGKDITSISGCSFNYAYKMTEVVFEEGSKLEKIGPNAFLYTQYLTDVRLPDTVKSIGVQAFAYGAKAMNVYMPQSIESISNTAFKNRDVVLNVAEGTYAESFAIKNNIPYETRAFVESVVASGECGENATWTLYQSGKMVISGSGRMDDYLRESEQPWAAYRMQIKNIVIGKDITHIGQYAFGFAHNVQSVIFEEGSKLEFIGAVSFYYMLYTTDITLPETVKSIGNLAFGYCSRLDNVYMPQSISYIHTNAFNKSNSVKLNVAEGTYAETFAKNNEIAYESRAFVESVVASGECGEKATWTLYESGKMVIGGSGAMYDYANQNAQPWVDYRMQIKRIEIGKGITHIGQYAFGFAHNVKEVVFEEGSQLQSIGAVSFYYMLYTTEIELPETVKRINNLAFAYCSKLKEVYIPQTASFIHAQAFKNSSNVELQVAEGSYAHEYAVNKGLNYTTRPYIESVIDSGECVEKATWTLYESGKMVIGGKGAMHDYANQSAQPWEEYRMQIKHIVIGKGITHIGQHAFSYAHNVKSVTFEEGSQLETIGAAGFMYFLYTTEIELPETVTKIGNLAFGYCKKLESVYVPEGAWVSGSAFNSTKIQ